MVVSIKAPINGIGSTVNAPRQEEFLLFKGLYCPFYTRYRHHKALRMRIRMLTVLYVPAYDCNAAFWKLRTCQYNGVRW